MLFRGGDCWEKAEKFKTFAEIAALYLGLAWMAWQEVRLMAEQPKNGEARLCDWLGWGIASNLNPSRAPLDRLIDFGVHFRPNLHHF